MCIEVFVIIGYLFDRELAEDRKSNGDGGIEMAAGNMADGVDHDHDNEAKCHTYPWKCYRTVYFIYSKCTTPYEYQKIRSNRFRNHLLHHNQILSVTAQVTGRKSEF